MQRKVYSKTKVGRTQANSHLDNFSNTSVQNNYNQH